MIRAAVPRLAGLNLSARVPASKSVTNRALLLAATSRNPVLVRSPLACEDATAIRAALEAAGAEIRETGDGLLVRRGIPCAGESVLDVRDSGTACRFLAAYASTSGGGRYRLTGSARLQQRPIGPLVDALRQMGADVEYAGRAGYPPLSIGGRRLSGGRVRLDASLSSQFASALLLTAPLLDDRIDVVLEGRPVSRAYLETTAEALSEAGISVERRVDGWSAGPGEVAATELSVPADFSSAVALASGVAVAGGRARLLGLAWPSTQADAAAFSVLEAAGVEVRRDPEATTVSGRASRPVTVEASGFPDAVPCLAAVAAGLPGESEFSGVAHLRIKESDRAAAITAILSRAGSACEMSDGVLRVSGRPEPATGAADFPTFGDHRIVMAATLLALRQGGWVENPRAVDKSYPSFFEHLFS